MLKCLAPATVDARLEFEGAREAVVSWNSRERRGRLEVRVGFADGTTSSWLPYVAWHPLERRSLCGRDEVAAIETDVIRASSDFVGLEVRSMDPLEALYVTTPPERAVETADTPALAEVELDVPALSQYVPEFPEQRGWCAPASIAMLLRFCGKTVDVVDAAEGVLDAEYGGTGNWAFNAAYAGSLGLRGAVVYLRDLAQARGFLAAGIPVAVSLSWADGELAGAPLGHSDGHIVILRGFSKGGAVLVNDPAHPQVRATYLPTEFRRAWLGHGGVAFVVMPPQRLPEELVALSA